MIYDVRHQTTYRYTLPVSISHHLLHLEPRDTAHQRVEWFAIRIDPEPGFDDRGLDAFGNPTRMITLDQGDLHYDYLIVATGARHSYFGHEEWTPFAPGLKSIGDALEIRRRVLSAERREARSCRTVAQEAQQLEPQPVCRGQPRERRDARAPRPQRHRAAGRRSMPRPPAPPPDRGAHRRAPT